MISLSSRNFASIDDLAYKYFLRLKVSGQYVKVGIGFWKLSHVSHDYLFVVFECFFSGNICLMKVVAYSLYIFVKLKTLLYAMNIYFPFVFRYVENRVSKKANTVCFVKQILKIYKKIILHKNGHYRTLQFRCTRFFYLSLLNYSELWHNASYFIHFFVDREHKYANQLILIVFFADILARINFHTDAKQVIVGPNVKLYF